MFAIALTLPVLLARLERLHRPGALFAPWVGLLPSTLGTAITASIAFQLAAQGFGLHFSLAQAAGCLTLLFVGMVLPISFAGLGLQESILLLVAQGMGMPIGPVLGLSVVLHVQRLVPALVGMGIMALRGLETIQRPKAGCA